jgi:hypothetical protein
MDFGYPDYHPYTSSSIRREERKQTEDMAQIITKHMSIA